MADNLLYVIIGQNIRARRRSLGMSQQVLAEMANISLSFLGHIERGTRKLSVETLCSIIRVLECSADSLLGINTAPAESLQAARDLLNMAMQISIYPDAAALSNNPVK